MEMEIMEKQFGEKLAKHEVAPPADIWQKISDRLDHHEVLADITPTTKTMWLTRERIVRAAAAAALLIGVESVIHFYFKEDNTTVATSVKTDATTPQENTPKDALKTEPATTNTTVAHVEKTSNSTHEKAAKNTNISGIQEAVAHEEIIVAPVPQLTIVENQQEEATAVAPVIKEHNNATSVPSNAVPVYSLKLLDKDVPANDEITVIDPKAKKVIIIEKGIEKPKIDYSSPKRF